MKKPCTQSTLRRAWLVRSIALGAVAALGFSSTSCLALAGGVKDTEIKFVVPPNGGGSFNGWTEITIDGDTSQANSAILEAVTLDVQQPAGTTDLSFLKSLRGELVLDDQRTLVVTGNDFPRDEQSVALDVKFHEDIRPFFKNGKTLRVEWSGSTNPAFTRWPSDNQGFEMRGRIKIDIE